MFGSSYNYDVFKKSTLMKNAVKHFAAAPSPGDKAPDFELRTIEGDKIQLSDYRDEKNVVLTFGSATCPLTAASIGALNDLYEDYMDNEDVEFLFVYVREAHPGEQLPAHGNMADKIHAAEVLRDEEELRMPVLVDDLNGKVHRKYGSSPNPTFLIDKSGRIAYRQLATNASELGEAIEELLERQEERGVDHAVVHGGESMSVPAVKPMLYSYRALERGGDRAIQNFRDEFGMPGRWAVMGSRVARPVAENPGLTLATAAAIAGVIGAGLYAGKKLRERRFANRPYRFPSYRRDTGYNDYEAVGI